jgi:hypothetical protein
LDKRVISIASWIIGFDQFDLQRLDQMIEIKRAAIGVLGRCLLAWSPLFARLTCTCHSFLL